MDGSGDRSLRSLPEASPGGSGYRWSERDPVRLTCLSEGIPEHDTAERLTERPPSGSISVQDSRDLTRREHLSQSWRPGLAAGRALASIAPVTTTLLPPSNHAAISPLSVMLTGELPVGSIGIDDTCASPSSAHSGSQSRANFGLGAVAAGISCGWGTRARHSQSPRKAVAPP